MKQVDKIILKDIRPPSLTFKNGEGKTITLTHTPHDIVLNKKPPALPFVPKTREQRYV